MPVEIHGPEDRLNVDSHSALARQQVLKRTGTVGAQEVALDDELASVLIHVDGGASGSS